MKSVTEQIKLVDEAISVLNQDQQNITKQLKKLQAIFEEADSILQVEKKALFKFDSQARELNQELSTQKQIQSDAKLSRTKMEGELLNFSRDISDMQSRQRDCVEAYPWIETQQYIFII